MNLFIIIAFLIPIVASFSVYYIPDRRMRNGIKLIENFSVCFVNLNDVDYRKSVVNVAGTFFDRIITYMYSTGHGPLMTYEFRDDCDSKNLSNNTMYLWVHTVESKKSWVLFDRHRIGNIAIVNSTMHMADFCIEPWCIIHEFSHFMFTDHEHDREDAHELVTYKRKVEIDVKGQSNIMFFDPMTRYNYIDTYQNVKFNGYGTTKDGFAEGKKISNMISVGQLLGISRVLGTNPFGNYNWIYNRTMDAYIRRGVFLNAKINEKRDVLDVKECSVYCKSRSAWMFNMMNKECSCIEDSNKYMMISSRNNNNLLDTYVNSVLTINDPYTMVRAFNSSYCIELCRARSYECISTSWDKNDCYLYNYTYSPNHIYGVNNAIHRPAPYVNSYIQKYIAGVM